MSNLGIYGGTFAPVHNGHVFAANAFLDALGLDRLLVIPTRKPPHKEISPDDDPGKRLEMLRLAFPEGGKIEVSDFEIRSEAPSYTALTLRHFAKEGQKLYFFCGTDMFVTLAEWYHPEEIFSLATIVHIRREDVTKEDLAHFAYLTGFYEGKYGGSVIHLDTPPYPLSSTEVRAAVKEGRDISGMVPDKVKDYILENGLYRV